MLIKQGTCSDKLRNVYNKGVITMGDYDLVRNNFGYVPRPPNKSSMYHAINSFHIIPDKKKDSFWKPENSLTRKKKRIKVE